MTISYNDRNKTKTKHKRYAIPVQRERDGNAKHAHGNVQHFGVIVLSHILVPTCTE